MKKKGLLVLAGLAALLSAGCLEFLTQNTTSPSTTPAATLQGMGGSWASVSSVTPPAGTCTDFHWSITEFTGTTGSGTFTATCAGNLAIAGTAHGTLSGTTVNWTASATGTGPGNVSCPISLTGTASFDGTQFRIPYTGTACGTPVSGTEILRKS
jgi:hypothetical protein